LKIGKRKKMERRKILKALGVTSLRGIDMKQREAILGRDWKSERELRMEREAENRRAYGKLGPASPCTTPKLSSEEKVAVLKQYDGPISLKDDNEHRTKDAAARWLAKHDRENR
jgi:hypothetical protein